VGGVTLERDEDHRARNVASALIAALAT
jgi:hypothetical protein